MQLDKNGLIVTQELDGGDTCAEEGRYWFLYWFNFVYMSQYHVALKLPDRGHPDRIMDLLETSPGVYVRNPNSNPPNPEAKWETDPSTVSRDQLKPIIWYCGAFRDHKRLGRLFLKVLSRGFFAQNIHGNWNATGWKVPDTMIFSLGNFIRAGGWWTAILYPLLFIFDLIDLVGVLLALLPIVSSDSAKWYNPLSWFNKKDGGQVDDNNMDIDLLGAVAFKPTPISWLSRKVWGHFRPANKGNSLGYTNNCLAAMAWYHDPKNGGNEEVVLLYTAPLLKYLN